MGSPLFYFMQTLEEIIQQTYRSFEGSSDYPEVDGDDYNLIADFTKDAIKYWASYAPDGNLVKWQELYTLLSNAADGEKTTVSGQNTYSAPGDFSSITSQIKITYPDGRKEYFSYKKVDKAMLSQDAQERFYFITGNFNSGFKVTFSPDITEDGGVIEYAYYKKPKIPTAPSEILEMKKPYFCVCYNMARLYEQDNRSSMVNFWEGKMGETIELAMMENEVSPEGNFFGDDDQEAISSLGFGQ